MKQLSILSLLAVVEILGSPLPDNGSPVCDYAPGALTSSQPWENMVTAACTKVKVHLRSRLNAWRFHST